jgi:hypothetical protein
LLIRKAIQTVKRNPKRIETADTMTLFCCEDGYQEYPPETLESVDFTQPIILAPYGGHSQPYTGLLDGGGPMFGVNPRKGGHYGFVVIDGHHRIAAAREQGITELPFFVLTAAETMKAITARK